MRIGSLVYATEQGLGILAKSFFDAGVLTDVLVVEHAHRPTRWEWYPNAPREHIRGVGSKLTLDFCASMDAMVFFETPFYWGLLKHCRDVRVPTVLMPMYECMPKEWPYEPTIIINPSHLDQQYYPHGTHIPVPVDIPWRKRERAEVFVHNAGNGGLKGRNGTAELLQAMEQVRSPLKLIVRSQEKLNWKRNMLGRRGGPEVELRVGTVPYEQLWHEGDAFVFPEKFNGLSLPLQEARAAGMLVVATNRFPMDQWLPLQPLIPVRGYNCTNISSRCVDFLEAVVEPQDIAMKLDQMYGKDISNYSEDGRKWAEEMSWKNLKPRYMELLCELCT